MKGILLEEDQILWLKDMIERSYEDEDATSRVLGALEVLIYRPQEEWVHAMNITSPSTLTFVDDIAHEKGE